MEIIQNFESERNHRRPHLDPINWTKESKEADEAKLGKELKAGEKATVAKATETTAAEELAALNKTSRGNLLRKLLKRNLSSTSKARGDGETAASVSHIVKETAFSKEEAKM